MLAGGQIVLSWPAPSPGFTLEEADGLEPGQEWRVVSETPMLNLAGDRLTITVADGPGNKFYRLRHP